jgi:predicted CopG family antitoxin
MIRTIELDEDAFKRLEQVRRAAESHSEVIRRCVPRRMIFGNVVGVLEKQGEAISDMDALIECRIGA